MSGQKTIARTLIAAVAAILVSSVAVGSAIGSAITPAQVGMYQANSIHA
jgi:hypothetical protein